MEVKYHDPDLGQPAPSITTRTRLKWPQMADVIDHTRQYCNTTWENKQENEYRLLIFPYKCSGTSVVTSWGKLLSTWRGVISCELVRKLSQDWEDDRINSAGGPKTMIRPQSCQDPEKLCLLFPQTFSMKSIVSRPLECNFSLSLSLFLLCGIEIAIVWNGALSCDFAWHS